MSQKSRWSAEKLSGIIGQATHQTSFIGSRQVLFYRTFENPQIEHFTFGICQFEHFLAKSQLLTALKRKITAIKMQKRSLVYLFLSICSDTSTLWNPPGRHSIMFHSIRLARISIDIKPNDRLIDRLIDRLVGRLIDRLADRLIDCSLERSYRSGFRIGTFEYRKSD